MATTGLASPLDFVSAEWLTVANGLWAALVPTILRYINSKDAAFGVVAEVAAKEVSKKLSTASKKATAKKPVAKKAVAKKPVAKKKSSR
jgi:histone H1/5